MTWCKCAPCKCAKKSGKTAEVHKPQANMTKTYEKAQKTITKHEVMKHNQNNHTNNTQIRNTTKTDMEKSRRSPAEVPQKARRSPAEVPQMTNRHQNAHILKLHTENHQESGHTKAQKNKQDIRHEK